jgi:hypothetical protein
MKSCAICKMPFNPTRPLQAVCSLPCAIEYTRYHPTTKAQKMARRTARRALQARREALKTRSDHMNELQKICNRYVRLRDAGKPCISCGRNTGAKMNAGHFLSVGSHPELRFDVGDNGGIGNIFLQCEHCNSWKSGNQVKYRAALVEKYGEAAVSELERQKPPAKWTIDQLEEMKEAFKAKIKALQAL